MPSHTGEKLAKILSFNDETRNTSHSAHTTDKDSLLEKHYYLLKSLPKKASVDTLLNRFVVETMKLIPCDEIEYSSSDSHFYFIVGEAAHHQCCYQLRYLNIDLGKIKFSRKETFSDDEIEMLEIMVSGLIQPLQTRVNHHKLMVHMDGADKSDETDLLLDDLEIMTADLHVGKES